MFASRGASGGGKGGKYSVEDLYGISKKPKASTSSASIVTKSGTRSSKTPEQRSESEAIASQILEAAHRLVERRRLELYLRECGLSLAECEAERSAMPYRMNSYHVFHTEIKSFFDSKDTHFQQHGE
ncbi:hypothetical protein GOODEAATRI_002999 [Goodea atripinnis]|uniref:Uncharacterized protein n=1 Tax=Goodea atripinnis TaxID=208336 RepID=A0ABV0PUU9_9TELE